MNTVTAKDFDHSESFEALVFAATEPAHNAPLYTYAMAIKQGEKLKQVYKMSPEETVAQIVDGSPARKSLDDVDPCYLQEGSLYRVTGNFAYSDDCTTDFFDIKWSKEA
jgi:hypothetical protein